MPLYSSYSEALFLGANLAEVRGKLILGLLYTNIMFFYSKRTH